MYKNVKYKLLILCSFVCVYIFFHNNLYAMTQEEVGKAIATFAINFQKAADGGQTWTYDYDATNRSQAYHGQKHSDGTYHADCVGWVSMCLHQSIGLDAPNVASGQSGFVTPTKYNINYAGRADGSVIEKVTGKLMPGDILQNSHHVMIYVGNIDGEDRIVHSVGSPLSYDTFAEYAKKNSTRGSDIDGVYTNAWRITKKYAATINLSDIKTTWNGSGGDYSWGSSSSNTNSDSTNLEDFVGSKNEEITEDDTKKNYRIVNVNDKLPIYKHILLTEKYNFNRIQWKRYGHGYDGTASPTQDDLVLGLRYPKDDNNTELGKFVSMVLPYLQTWYIPLGMYSGILTSTSGFSISGNAYTGEAIYSGDNNQEIVWNFLRSKGLSEVSTAAIMGNISREAGVDFNPAAIEVGNNNAGFGLCQWSYGRRTAIVNYAAAQGKEPDDITLQLDFLWLEMSGEDPTVECQFLGSSSFEEFQSFTDIDEATNYFCDEFERPNAKYAHKDERRTNAQMYYEQFQGSAIVENSGGSYGSTGSFTTYDLTEDQLIKIANLCEQEQGTAKGAAAEASLMANLFELKKNGTYGGATGADGLYNYVRNGGWFAKAATYMDQGPGPGRTVKSEVVEAVRSVLIDGKRTLPGYIDEHDSFGDVESATNDGVQISKRDRTQYVQNKTIIDNTYGSTYTFYCFPDENSDPFGYTSEEKRQEIGDFCYDFDSGSTIGGSGGTSSVEIPKAAKNVNFPYGLIKNGYHEIIVNRYDMQKYTLNTKFKEYIEHKKKSVAIIVETSVTTREYTTVTTTTESVNIPSSAANSGQNNNNSSTTTSSKPVTKVSYTIESCNPDEKVSDTPKNTRKNENGNIDYMLEDLVSSSTAVTTKYFLHRAFTFDMIYVNEFDYQRYSETDANARKNADSESITNRVPYNELINEENRFEEKDLVGDTLEEIAQNVGAKVSNNPISTSTTSQRIPSGNNTDTDQDGNIKTTTKTQKSTLTTTTTRKYRLEGKEFIENDGEEIYVSRTWEDKLSQTSTDSHQVGYDDMIEYNENEENKSNRSTITQEEFESSKDDEYKKYKQMSKVGDLNFIDIINSNPKLISTYLSDTAKESEYMGYNRNDDLLMSYDQLKKLVDQTKNESGLVPYAYFISLDVEMGYSNYSVNQSTLSLTPGFGWPVDLTNNDGARKINCIYPYTEAYGSSHGAIDIAPGKGENIIIAAAAGKVISVSESTTGYGNSVLLQHEGGFYTRYSHLASINSTIVSGVNLNKGDPIGIMGTTGNSTGVHLDFEIYQGGITSSNRVDPLDYYITEPEYGTIDPATIKSLPSGYTFKSEKGASGSTSTGLVDGKTNILVIAGHSINSSDARGTLPSTGYDETIETRKYAIALANAINRNGMNAVIANRVLAGNKDTEDNGIIWGRYSLYSAASMHGNSIYDQFKGYDHAIEIHFNAAGSSGSGRASGSLLVNTSSSLITQLDEELLACAVKYNSQQKKRDPLIRSIKDINQLRARGVNITYLEVEFYDNKAAMDYISQNYEAMAEEMAQVLKKHFK